MLSIFFLLVPFLGLNSQSIYASAADPTVDKFSTCLTKNGIPSAEVPKILYSPTNVLFTSVLNAYNRNLRYNTTSTKKPTLIVTPLRVQGVQATVICTKEAGLQLKTRSGGHDYEGLSYVAANNFVILDMFNIKNITVDLPSKTAWVQAGAILGEVYYNIWKSSNLYGYPAGVCHTVGVGGHISGAGYGPLIRKYGLTVDNVVDAEIVDVNGKILDRKGMGEDLFWAIRGGGAASFGVVLSYRINLVPVPPVVTVFRVERYEDQNAADILVEYQDASLKYDENLFIRTLIQPVTRNQTKLIRLTFIGMHLGNCDSVLSVMNTQFPKMGFTKNDCMEMTYIKAMLFWGNFDNTTAPEALKSRVPDPVKFIKRKSDYVTATIQKDALTSIFKKMVELGKVGLVFNSYGGKMARIAESDTPFPHRAGILYKIQYSLNWNDADPKITEDNLAKGKELYSFMAPHVSSNPRQAFLNYRDIDIGTTTNGKNSYEEAKVYGVKYFKNNFERLVKVKTAVDPENFFRNEQSIPPLPK